jgi:hypothetical protein
MLLADEAVTLVVEATLDASTTHELEYGCKTRERRSTNLMNDPKDSQAGWSQKLIREMKAYALNVGYLFVFLGMFMTYKRLILAQYQISYLNYGASLVEALILAKVIMLGEALRLSRGMEHRPLIVPTLYKTVVFSLLVGAFTVIENIVVGWLRGRPPAQSFDDMFEKKYELIAECLVTFLAFIPFFGIRELARVMGKGKMQELFFRRRATQS